MMTRISVEEFVKHADELLKRVEQGEAFEIVRNSGPIACLIYCGSSNQAEDYDVFQELLRLRKEHPLGTLEEIREWRHQGLES